MLRYYTCHVVWKRCSEILYALETIDLDKYPAFNILSIGCGAAPDLMAFAGIAGNKKISYNGIDIANTWEEVHDFISRNSGDTAVNFVRRDIYELLNEPGIVTNPSKSYNVVLLQYMIAGHIHSDREERINNLFDEIVDKLVTKKATDSPLLFIINDIDHKAWICDYFNLFIQKLRQCGQTCTYHKRHFEPREDGGNAGSKIYASHANKFTSMIPAEHRDKYNAHASCSAAQLVVEVS
jgi:hypothetical protein